VDVARCRDCEAELVGPFCHECGEEAEQDHSVRGLLSELAEELTDYDSRVFKTLRALFLQPGFLTEEYMAGHRRAYIRPLKLFLVIAGIQLIALTNESGAGLLRLEFLSGFDPGIEVQLEEKAKAQDTTPAEITSGIDDNAQTIYSVLQFGALGFTAAVVAVLFRGKRWSYMSHLLFAMHLYCFRYAVATLMSPALGRFPPSLAVVYLVNAVYLYLALRRVYQPGPIGGILKSLLVYLGVFAQGGLLMITSLFGAYWCATR
jgi:hypothetical protein